MTQYITKAVFNGTSIEYAIPGKDVDSVMLKIRKHRELRNASVFLFFNRKTGKLVTARVN